ncbi:hypothetical protein KFL_002060170 [Klebsormidium nitens]|uniref:Transmembrane protein n=1 Tax=Klebsormidium nitens TaxID=105231 RepID=A0A1Y1I7Y4_KLENI|nr:hypothetical protein KFL_002060170 [Klebsormidium nitens]|eukprot:GAQ84796.1 hypothetical protein KFL_002060170 [Klebsormidium nitens]
MMTGNRAAAARSAQTLSLGSTRGPRHTANTTGTTAARNASPLQVHTLEKQNLQEDEQRDWTVGKGRGNRRLGAVDDANQAAQVTRSRDGSKGTAARPEKEQRDGCAKQDEGGTKKDWRRASRQLAAGRGRHGERRVAMLACTPPAILGASLFLHLLITFSRVLLESCGASEWKLTSLPRLETLLRAGFCAQNAIFSALFNGSVGLLVLGDFLCLVSIYLLSTVRESMRAHATGQIVALGLTPFLGASGSFSLLWLPAHFPDGARGRFSAAARAPARLTRDDAATVTAVLSALVGLLGPFLVAEDSHWALFLAGTLFPLMVPILAQALCCSHDPEAASKEGQGNEARHLNYVVLLCFLVAATLGVFWRIFSCLVLVSNPSARAQFVAVVTAESASDAVVLYVLLDTMGLFLCFAYLALLEDGPLAALCTLAGAAALGPAAATALYLAYRERKTESESRPELKDVNGEAIT